jgi:hypothetical protein
MLRSPAGIVALIGLLGPFAGPGSAAERLDEAVLAGRIDASLAAGWKARKAVPATPADDAEFVRRAYLDLTGRVPDILEARDFLDNPDRNKRAKLIDTLLGGERYPVHFAHVWRDHWLPETSNGLMFGVNYSGFEAWLRGELKSNTGYHKLVQTMLGGSSDGYGVSNMFLLAHGGRPETMAGATSRLFMGVKLECAQCHDHPFARWSRKQFWELAAFYANGTVGRLRGPGEIPVSAGPALAREITIPGSEKKVSARFLDGSSPSFTDGEDSRQVLSRWLTQPNNPYFARAGVNRMWEQLTGTGLIEPLDEGGPDNPSSHPELLDELAEQYTIHHFDMKYLIRAIMLSQAYQLTSRQSHPSQADPRLFARMRVRGLSPAQLYDSLMVATGQPDTKVETIIDPRRAVAMNDPRSEFIRRFPNQDRRGEQKTSILQALFLMNGQFVAEATSLELNKNLAIIAEARTVRTSRRVEQLYLITLGRKPKPDESARLVKYVDRGGPSGDQRLALCDVFWALLNSSEFSVNH